jgi:hypothetical protein
VKEVEEVRAKKGVGIRASGKRAVSLQQAADSERKARREKRRGIFPLTSDPFLGGARKTKEKGLP